MLKLDKRRQEILNILLHTPLATVGDLAERLSVSQETIRKDLCSLEGQGHVVRIHGGAALADSGAADMSYSFRESYKEREKWLIARAAAQLVEPSETIILENCTVTVKLCRTLLETPELLKTLVIATNSFRIAQLLEMGNLCRRLLFLGGWVNGDEHSTRGQFTVDALQSLYVDTVFLGGAALSADFMLSAYFEDDMRFQKQALKSAAKSVLVIDSGKYPTSAVFSVAPLSQIGSIVTDTVFLPADKAAMADAGVRLIEV